MYKISNTKDGIELFLPKDNAICNFNDTTWEIIKTIKNSKSMNESIRIIAKKFKISDEDAKEDIQTVLSNLKKLKIDLNKIPLEIKYRLYQPRNVHFDITSRCNSNCIYCISSDLMKNQKELSIKDIVGTIKQLNDLGMWILTLSGGEPLLRDDIFDILDYTKKQGILVNILTNGLVIDDSISKKLEKYKLLTKIQVSLDSYNPEHHEKHRGVKGCFKETMQGINSLLKYDINPIISCVVTKINVGDIEKTIDFLNTIGIKRVRIAPASFFSEKTKLNKKEILLDKQQLESLGKKVVSLSKKYKSMEFSISPVLLSYKKDTGYIPDILYCTVGQSILYISSSGDVYPCNGLIFPEFKIGNINNKSIKELWLKSDILRSFRKLEVNDFNKCKNCDLKESCNGGCRGNAYRIFNSVTEHDPVYCAYFDR